MIARMTAPTSKDLYLEIGQLIRRRRKVLGQTQAQLAAHLQLARASIANIETGRQKILLHQLYQLASGLQMQVAELLPVAKSEPSGLSPKDLPLPTDLSAKQKLQISQLLSDLPTKKGSDE
jgi:transcriptional regulator with XRE-family HTH domain